MGLGDYGTTGRRGKSRNGESRKQKPEDGGQRAEDGGKAEEGLRTIGSRTTDN